MRWKILVVVVLVGVIGWVTREVKEGWSGFWIEKKQNEKVTVGTEPGTLSVQTVTYKTEVVAENLEVPWSMVFTGNNRILVTERKGVIRQIVNFQLKEEVLIRLAEVSSRAEEGLMGLTKDPDYQKNKRLFACYAYEKNGQLVDKVVSLLDQGELITLEKIIIDDIPSAQFHVGCALGFGHDRKLYVTTGDATDKTIAQDLESLGGKILRLNSDGSVPSDNPFFGSPVYSYGHRNPQGIAWHPVTGVMYATEHGPSGFDGPPGGDEVNVVIKGYNYGWPLVSHNENKNGLQAPFWVMTPAVAPASAMFYQGSVFSQFKNNLFFGALKGEGVYRLVLVEGTTNQVKVSEKLGIELGRIRAVVEGPDEYIYFSTSNRDGRGQPRNGDDKIIRIVPVN